jgi:long-chain acyl-CoA synthetase
MRPFPAVEVVVREGLIWVRSPWLCQGYAGEPGPLQQAVDGFATVGDRGHLTDGVLTVNGRSDAVLTAGATVIVADVEQLLRRVAGCDVVVLGLPHARLGAQLVAVLTNRDRHRRAYATARAALSRAQRPVRWYLRPELPLTDAGKVDRRRLADLVARGALEALPVPGGRP